MAVSAPAYHNDTIKPYNDGVEAAWRPGPAAGTTPFDVPAWGWSAESSSVDLPPPSRLSRRAAAHVPRQSGRAKEVRLHDRIRAGAGSNPSGARLPGQANRGLQLVVVALHAMAGGCRLALGGEGCGFLAFDLLDLDGCHAEPGAAGDEQDGLVQLPLEVAGHPDRQRCDGRDRLGGRRGCRLDLWYFARRSCPQRSQRASPALLVVRLPRPERHNHSLWGATLQRPWRLHAHVGTARCAALISWQRDLNLGFEVRLPALTINTFPSMP